MVTAGSVHDACDDDAPNRRLTIIPGRTDGITRALRSHRALRDTLVSFVFDSVPEQQLSAASALLRLRSGQEWSPLHSRR